MEQGAKSREQGFVTDSAFPFKTQDAVLANCLRIAGLNETALSPVHIYDAEILFKIGGGQRDVGSDNKIVRASRFAGLTSIEAARKAHKEGIRGRVEYHFEHSPILEPLLTAYKDQVKQIEESEGDAGAAIREIMRMAAGRPGEGTAAGPPRYDAQDVRATQQMDEREALLRILCIALKLRIQFVNRWKDVAPVLVVPHVGAMSSQTLPGGAQVQKYPGGKLVPINASDELLRRMKLL